MVQGLESNSREAAAPRFFADIPLQRGYASGEGSALRDFYEPVLHCATLYDRAVGYFSSGVFAVAGLAFSSFAQRGGHMRLICSPYLSQEDFEVLARGTRGDEREQARQSLLRSLEENNLPGGTEILATLLSLGVLEVRIAIPAVGEGIFHSKVGVMTDARGETLSFIGSANESASAWSDYGNHESLEIFRAWESREEAARVENHRRYFDRLWRDLNNSVRVVRIEDVCPEIREFSDESNFEDILAKVRASVPVRDRSDKPVSRQLLPYQRDVLADWRARGRRGIVRFATGAGKTFTAISAITEWVSAGRPALVIVPSVLLMRQWYEEIRSTLDVPDLKILRVGGGVARGQWENELTDATRNDTTFGPRVILATLQTASTPHFEERVLLGEHLLVVVDEVHRVGAPSHRRILTWEAVSSRLGLSATPERFGDPDGTKAIYDFFEQDLEPMFGLEDALRARRLVPYDYRFVTVPLEDDEFARWLDLTNRIGQILASRGVDRDSESDGPLFHLLLRRARILKKAANKVAVARTTIENHWEDHDRWLVYCEDRKQLDAVASSLRESGRSVLTYHTGAEGDLQATLRLFEQEPSVLVAIRCLDEGIDIPVVNKALILASSLNPREYIQRRGRVLRLHPGKYSAQIYDVLVTDPDGNLVSIGEARRAIEFARCARNPDAATALDVLLGEISPELLVSGGDRDIDDE